MRIVLRAATVPHNLVPFASCVLRRESGGILERVQSGVGARNGASSAQGRWQFINNDWQHSLPWMVKDRLIRFGMSKAQAREVRTYLDSRQIATWHGYWQDIGFIEVMARGGKHHWSGGSHSC
jgi:hypothetical protein